MKFTSLKWGLAVFALQTVLSTSAYAASTSETLFSDTSKVAADKMAAIQEAAKQGLLSGDPQGTFRPTATLSRQEFAVLLVKALKMKPTGETSTFKDVAATQYSLPYIEAVQQAGLLTGDGKGNFHPNDPVSREELAAVFVRAVGGIDARGGTASVIQDQAQVSRWAADSVDTALRLGLIDTSDDKLNPKGNIKREDIAKFLLEIFKTEEQRATIDSVDGDIVTINGVPYLIEGKLKELIGNTNRDALKGAILKFNSVNRNVDGLKELEIVQKDAVFTTKGLPADTSLRVSADGLKVKGDVAGELIVKPGTSKIQLDGNVKQLVLDTDKPVSIQGSGSMQEIKVLNAGAKITLDPAMKVQNIQLPNHAQISEIIKNYNEVKNQIVKVQNADGTVQTPVVTTPSSNTGGGTPPSPSVPVNHAPYVAKQPESVRLSSGVSDSVDIGGVFKDEDQDVLSISGEALTPGVVKLELTGNSLKLIPLNTGSTVVRLTATDGKLKQTAEFTVTVTAPVELNHAPTVTGNLLDATIGADAGNKDVNLTNIFTDEDGDSLTYTAVSSNTGVATVPSGSITGSSFAVTPVYAGTTTITVTAHDNHGGTVDTTFTVTVTAPVELNHAPTVTGNLLDVTIGVNAGNKDVNLTNIFTDEDGDSLTYTAVSSNTGVATVPSGSITGSSFAVTPVNAGTTTITVTAHDNHGGTVDTTFTVTVTAPVELNHAPTVTGNLLDATIGADAGNKDVNLTNIFTDEDGDVLTYTAVSSNIGVATVPSGSITGNNFAVTPVNAGTTTITVTAHDGNGATVDTTFTVTVTASEELNYAPTVIGNITNVTVAADAGDQTVDLKNIFADEDGDTLTYTAVSSNIGVATVPAGTITGSSFAVTPVNEGTATITVTASDGHGGTVNTNFTVTVTASEELNFAPTVIGNIKDATFGADAGDQVVDLKDIFADENGDTLTYTAVSSNIGVATVPAGTITGSSFAVTPVNEGTATITVTASDGHGGTVNTNFTVTVTADMNAPKVMSTKLEDNNRKIVITFDEDVQLSDPEAFGYIYILKDSGQTTSQIEDYGPKIEFIGKQLVITFDKPLNEILLVPNFSLELMTNDFGGGIQDKAGNLIEDIITENIVFDSGIPG